MTRRYPLRGLYLALARDALKDGELRWALRWALLAYHAGDETIDVDDDEEARNTWSAEGEVRA